MVAYRCNDWIIWDRYSGIWSLNGKLYSLLLLLLLFFWYLLREKNIGVKVKIASLHQTLAFEFKYSGIDFQFRKRHVFVVVVGWKGNWYRLSCLCFHHYHNIYCCYTMEFKWWRDNKLLNQFDFPSNWSRSFFSTFCSFFSTFFTHDSYTYIFLKLI